jgi:hypothetical protein
MKKALISLPAGSGLLVKPLSNGIEMKTITTNGGMQSGEGLTQEQRQLLSYFSNMDDTSRQFILDCAASNARVFPRQRPKLRVIGGRAA